MGAISSKGNEMARTLIAFGNATGICNEEMSTYTTPMVIREFYFGANIATDFAVTKSLGLQFSYWGVNVDFKVKSSYAEHAGITIKCTIVPMSIMVAEIASGSVAEARFDDTTASDVQSNTLDSAKIEDK